MPNPQRTRTTVAFESAVYEEARRLSGALGYNKVGDLVNEAVREYLGRQRTLLRDRAMTEAARDEGYRRALRQVSDDLEGLDAENLPDY